MKTIHLDALDLEILTQVGVDGRKSFTDLASELGVSVGTIRNRLARLEEQGTIRFVGFVELGHVGVHAYATIYVRVSPSRMIEQVVAQLSQFPEVSFLASVAGEFDLHVDVQCLNNDHLTAFLQRRIHQIEGVVDTKTTMVLQIHKYGQPDLGKLKDSAESLLPHPKSSNP